MLVEIAICTWNRSGLLKQTLQSLCSLNIPASVEWQVLVVDNNSSDDTSAVIESMSDSLPIVSLFEASQGHTIARNAAVRHAQGDLLLWTDDDCKFNPDWLANYCREFENSKFDFWGSTITPEFISGKTPEWISENWDICKGCFASRDLGSQKIELTADGLPYGANFAVRTAIQKQYPFDESLGRQGSRVTGEDELDFMRRLLKAGHQGLWVPDNPIPVSYTHLTLPTKRIV